MTTEKKPRHRITRFHYTDLYCAALNNPDCMKIFKRMEEEGFDIVEHPEPGEFFPDYSVMFMYPHEIKPLDFSKLRPQGDPLSGGFKADAMELYSSLDGIAASIQPGVPPLVVIDSVPPELGALQFTARESYRGSAAQLKPLRDPDPEQPEIDPMPERPTPSGLLMSLLSRI